MPQYEVNFTHLHVRSKILFACSIGKKMLGSDRQCNDKSNMDLHKHNITKFKLSTCQIFQ